MFGLFKQIFTWWNHQTIGTLFFTLFNGKYAGMDEFGNKYYSNKKGKRWVIYKGEVEATKIPPEWYLWIHFLSKEKPQKNLKKFSWQKEHVGNLTGTEQAHKVEGSITSKIKKNIKKYESWKI